MDIEIGGCTLGNNSNFNINPEMLSNFANMFKNMNANENNTSTDNISNTSNNSENSNNFNIDMDMIFKIKKIMDKMNDTKNDPRANLLLSLKPYLKESRKEKVEQYIKLFSVGKVMEAFNSDNKNNDVNNSNNMRKFQPVTVA